MHYQAMACVHNLPQIIKLTSVFFQFVVQSVIKKIFPGNGCPNWITKYKYVQLLKTGLSNHDIAKVIVCILSFLNLQKHICI